MTWSRLSSICARDPRHCARQSRAGRRWRRPALRAMARELECDAGLLRKTAELGRLPVVNFAAGGIATPADAALMMQLGCDASSLAAVSSSRGDAAKRAKAHRAGHHALPDAAVLADVSAGWARPWSESTAAAWDRRRRWPAGGGRACKLCLSIVQWRLIAAVPRWALAIEGDGC